MTGSKVYIRSNGCIPNCLEGKAISRLVIGRGFELVDNPRIANVIILNACGFNSVKIRNSLRELAILEQEKQPDSEIVLTGCLDRICPDKINVGVKKIAFCELARYFESDESVDNTQVSSFIEDAKSLTGRADIYHIVTSTGCVGECSYCAIRKARGRIRSKSKDGVFSDFASGLAGGFKKFVLWGDDLGAYGIDQSENLIGLLEGIIEEFSRYEVKLYLHRINPHWLSLYEDGLCRISKLGIIKLIYSPIQSGSDRILNLMNRPYGRETILRSFRSIKLANEKTALKTDIMVGFPSESEEDFYATLNLLKECMIDDAEVFLFGAIENTPAHSMLDQVDEETKKRRRNLIWRFLPSLRFCLRREGARYSLTDRGMVNEEGLCGTLRDINPDYYD